MNGDTRNRTVHCVRLICDCMCTKKIVLYGHNINRFVYIHTWAIRSTLGYTQRIDTFTAAFNMRRAVALLRRRQKPLVVVISDIATRAAATGVAQKRHSHWRG